MLSPGSVSNEYWSETLPIIVVTFVSCHVLAVAANVMGGFDFFMLFHALLSVIWYEYGRGTPVTCGSGLIESGSSNSIKSGYGSTVFMAKNWRKKTAKIFFFSFFDHKFQFTYPYVSSKDVQVTVEEKPSALKKNIQHFKRWNLLTVFSFWGPFRPLGSGSGSRIRIRIRIQGPH